jgi:glycosyl transferase family 11
VITVRLQGGLGNQMFQYAAGYALARRLSVPLRLDLSWYREVTGRRYGLDVFSITGRIATDDEVRREGIRPPGRIARGLSQLRAQLGARLGVRASARPGYVREPGFPFWPGFLELADGSTLDGYWQSERYFAEVAEPLRGEFAMREAPDPANLRTLDAIRAGESVAVHVRRGDYQSDPHTRRYHGTTSPEYYQAAVRRMLAITKDPRFYVFSDDPDWAEAHLAFGAPTTCVRQDAPERDHEDLRLMSAARHHIIANSTFGWWGAWLAGAPGQTVIAPRAWFMDGPDARDVVPARWERI